MMNYEEFNKMLSRIQNAQTWDSVEECVRILHSITDHGSPTDRYTAEQAIMRARNRVHGAKVADATPKVANARQVGGAHYRTPIQHWDYVIANDLGYFEGQITKYVTRWRKKNGMEDLFKARHFLDKLIESQDPEGEATRAYVDQ